MILALILGVFIIVFFIGVIFNESFWQGYRNSKFLDELNKEEDTKDLLL